LRGCRWVAEVGALMESWSISLALNVAEGAWVS
jgi:hypothetical protein